MAHLSHYFDTQWIVRDEEFTSLGYVDAQQSGTLAFSDAVAYVRKANQNPAISVLITTPALVESCPAIKGVVAVEKPRDAFYQLHEQWINEGLYSPPITPHRGVNVKIHPSAVVADGCWIGDQVVIGENVVIRQPARIGNHVTIESGVRIAMEGILYHRTDDGMRIIPHGGYVDIEDHVALLTGSCVVRSIHDTDVTIVGRGSIIGLNSVVGHEAKVGPGVVVSNQCVLARRCTIGEGAFIGTNVFIREHVQIGEKAQVMAGTVVINAVAAGTTVSGNFATDHKVRIIRHAKGLREARLS